VGRTSSPVPDTSDVAFIGPSPDLSRISQAFCRFFIIRDWMHCSRRAKSGVNTVAKVMVAAGWLLNTILDYVDGYNSRCFASNRHHGKLSRVRQSGRVGRCSLHFRTCSVEEDIKGPTTALPSAGTETL
jgi:hypothetical protein